MQSAPPTQDYILLCCQGILAILVVHQVVKQLMPTSLATPKLVSVQSVLDIPMHEDVTGGPGAEHVSSLDRSLEDMPSRYTIEHRPGWSECHGEVKMSVVVDALFLLRAQD